MDGTTNPVIDWMRPIQFRGKIRLLSPLCPREGQRLANVFGYQMELDLGSWIDRLVYLGCYEAVNTRRFRNILNSNMTVIDVGSNIGYFMCLAARLVGSSGHVYALEPEPNNFKKLQLLPKRNAMRQVSLFPHGLGDRETSVPISSSKIPIDGLVNRSASMLWTDETAVQVPIKTLDHCIEAWGLDSVDLLKIDVDGYETNVIEGGKKSLASGKVKHLIIEFDEVSIKASGSSSEKLGELIESCGFLDISQKDAGLELFLGKTRDRHYIHKSAVKS